jgi:hypothetical protein
VVCLLLSAAPYCLRLIDPFVTSFTPVELQIPVKLSVNR